MRYNVGTTTRETDAMLSTSVGMSKPVVRFTMPNRTPLLPGFKRCGNCSAILPATPDYFSRDKSKRDGLTSACKTCARLRRHKWYSRNRQYAIDYSKQWSSEHYDRVLAYNREWRKANREKIYRYNENWKRNHRSAHLSSRRRRYILHADARCQEARKWRRANPDKVRIQWKVRQSRLRSAIGNHTPQDIRDLYEEQEGRCAYCGITLHNEYHVDHTIPISRGGSNNPSDLALTCPFCNLSKKDKTVAEWQKVRGW